MDGITDWSCILLQRQGYEPSTRCQLPAQLSAVCNLMSHFENSSIAQTAPNVALLAR